MIHARRDIWFVLSALILVLFVVFLLYPLVNVLMASLAANKSGQSGWAVVLGDPKYRAAIANTVLLGLIVTTTSTLIGVPLAFFMRRANRVG